MTIIEKFGELSEAWEGLIRIHVELHFLTNPDTGVRRHRWYGRMLPLNGDIPWVIGNGDTPEAALEELWAKWAKIASTCLIE